MIRTIFITEPTEKEKKQLGHRALYQYKHPNDNVTFWCDGWEAEAKKTQNKILDLIEAAPFTQTLRDTFIDLIEDYGYYRADEARQECWEAEAGEDL